MAGRWVEGEGPEVTSRSPASGESVLSFREAEAEAVERAVDAARDASHAWAAISPAERSALLLRAADRLDAQSADLSGAIVREVGKPIREAREEAERTVSILRYHAGAVLDPHGETIPTPDGRAFSYVIHRPLGVVALITPWNFPAAIPMWKIAPALAHGNAIVVKPAPVATDVAIRLVKAFDHLPPGVVNFVAGGIETGAALAEMAIDGLSFTGSTRAGREVALVAARNGVKYQAELGGKNASVVLEDADLDRAARVIASAANGFAGQKCTATSRVIVHRGVADEFSELLVHAFRALRVGRPAEETTDVGPMIDADAVTRVLGFVERAIASGAALLAGGRTLPELGSAYLEPTLLADVDPASELARTEVFGPVTALFRVDDYDAAVELVGNTDYGLAAAVFTKDLHHGLRFAEDVRVGIVRVNGATPGVLYNAPFAPIGDSGLGAPEQGKAARDFYTHVQTISITSSM